VTCAEFKESAAAYALGILPAQEERELEEHLSESIAHQGCHAVLESALRTTAALSAAVPPVQPPDTAWEAIESRLNLGQTGSRPRDQPRLPWLIGFAAAAVCLLAVIQALNYRRALTEQNAQLAQLSAAEAERERCAQELQALKNSTELQRAALALLELPSTQLVPLGAPQGVRTASRGTALFNSEQQKAIVLISALAPAVGKDYELWVIREGENPTPAGVFKPGPDGKAITQVDPRVLQAGPPGVFAVTLEPEGGSPAPTTLPFLVGSVRKT
jgi:anti-sigma-K factor RskA